MKNILKYGLVLYFAVSGTVSAQTHTVIVNFSGMQEYAGMKMVAKMINTSTKAAEGSAVIPALSNGSFSLTFTGTHAVSFNVDFYIDKDGNNAYDPPPVDAAWRISTPPLHSTVTLNFVNNTNYTDIGAGFSSVVRTKPAGNTINVLKIVNNTVEIPADLSGKNRQIQAFDLRGRLIWSENLPAQASKIDINHSRSGIVLIKIKDGNSIIKSVGVQ